MSLAKSGSEAAVPVRRAVDPMYFVLKRLLDVTVAGTATVLLLPFLLPIILALRLSGEGEVFYLQKRVGYKNRTFNIYKFATMLRDSPNMPGGEITVRDDPRLLPLGRVLRRTKINELPQLINVLRGEMSLVGPRPLMRVSFDMYSPEVQAIIYESKPGLTGIGSLVFRDEEALATAAKARGIEPRLLYREYIYPYKGQLESWYYVNRCMSVDIKILAGTVLELLFSGRGLVHRWFKDLPARSEALEAMMRTESDIRR